MLADVLELAGRIGPRWHRPDDTPESVSAAFMERAATFVRTLLDDLDDRRAPVTSSRGTTEANGPEPTPVPGAAG
jgi:hypothetical protein